MDRKRELDALRLFRSSCLTDSVCRSFKILKNSEKGKRFIHPLEFLLQQVMKLYLISMVKDPTKLLACPVFEIYRIKHMKGT